MPEFSFTSWLAMIFSGGMGVGLVFWGVAEPIMHLNDPPLGLAEPRSVEAAQLGMRYSFFHWGFHQWANFTLVGLAIAYVRFRHNSYGLISETFRPLLGERVDRGWGKAIDILAVVSTLFGVATTLGLGALQVNSGLSRLGVMDYSTTSQLMILGGLATLFTISAMTPLDKGIRHLSNANLIIASGLLLFVLVTGPTAFIFGELTQTLGKYLGNLIEMSLVTAPPLRRKVGGAVDHVLLGMGVELGAVRGQLYCPNIKGKNHSGVRYGGNGRPSRLEHAVVLNLWWLRYPLRTV